MLGDINLDSSAMVSLIERMERQGYDVGGLFAYLEQLKAERDELRDALTDAARMNADAVKVLRWLRDEVFALCEETENLEGDELFNQGRRYEAKGIRRAIGVVVTEKVQRITDMNSDIAEVLPDPPQC